jgi:RNA polymerase sigma factor (sigma-70 family)
LFGWVARCVSLFEGECTVGNQTVQIADAAAFLESNLPLVEAVVGEVARRCRVGGDALDEFRSLAFLKLVEHDYAVLRRFEGASSLRTYLTVVLQRVLLDHRNREWGRWRASAAARRLGPVAVRLEQLITRDGLSPGEAMAAVAPHADAAACAELADRLGRRATRGSRATLGEDAIPECVDTAPDPEAYAARREQAFRARAVRGALRDALRALPAQDHLLVTLRYRDWLSVANAARVLEDDAKPLYRRIQRVLDELRAVLCTDEPSSRLARELSRETWCDALPAGESGWWRQSISSNGIASNAPAHARGAMPRRRSARRLHRRLQVRTVRRDRAASL